MKISYKNIILTIFVAAGALSLSAEEPSVLFRNEDIDRAEGLMLFAPIEATPEGISQFLKHVYNRREYMDVLPNNFSHFVQFLQLGKSNQQNRAYTQAAIKLFSNKLKGSQYINAYAFSSMLDELPQLVNMHFQYKKRNSFDKHKTMLNTILYDTFLAKYEDFKKDPKEFFDALSGHILEKMHQEKEHADIPLHELRQTIVRFLELTTGKLVWSAQEPNTIWDNVKRIAKQFETLVEHNIITDQNDLDDLYWSLIHRFCYFMQLSHNELSMDFYETIKNDLASDQLLLLELEEQEEVIGSKRDCLTQAVLEGQARKQAIDMGVIVG